MDLGQRMAEMPTTTAGMCEGPATVTARLKGKKERLERELEQVNKVLEKLSSLPEVASLVDELSKLNY